MNYIWGGLIAISIIFGAINGRLNDVTNAMLESVQSAVNIAIALVGIMAFWLGIVRIAQKSGLVLWFSRIISPALRLIFNELPKNSPAFSNIALNFSANALGLANAATPFGIKTMQDLKEEAKKSGSSKDTASNSMCIFLGMNTAGFQLIPASVIAILLAAKAENPTEIILPTLIVTSVAFILAILIAKILAPFFRENSIMEPANECTKKHKDKFKGFSKKQKNTAKDSQNEGLFPRKISAKSFIEKEEKANRLKRLKRKGGF